MQTYHLADDFTDVVAEQALLASIVGTPTLYWEFLDLLTTEMFSHEATTWQQIALALEAAQIPRVPMAWLPAPDPHATVRRLADLRQRRVLAAVQERLAQALFDESMPAPDIVTLLEEETLRVHAALRCSTAGRLQWASMLLPQVLADAQARRLQREATGSAVLGGTHGLGAAR